MWVCSGIGVAYIVPHRDLLIESYRCEYTVKTEACRAYTMHTLGYVVALVFIVPHTGNLSFVGMGVWWYWCWIDPTPVTFP